MKLIVGYIENNGQQKEKLIENVQLVLSGSKKNQQKQMKEVAEKFIPARSFAYVMKMC